MLLTLFSYFSLISIHIGTSAGDKQSQCNSSTSDYQPNAAAFNASNTAAQLTAWWTPIGKSGTRFDIALGEKFGNDDFRCGIAESGCSITTCAGTETWVYQSAESATHLNEFFNNIYAGISLSQEDATQLTDNLADEVFGWKDPVWIPGEAMTWGTCALGILFASIGPAAQVISSAASAIQQQITDSVGPQPGLTRNQGTDSLNALFNNFSTSARTSIEQFANVTFAGVPDPENRTVVDYIKSGGFVTDQNIPSLAEAETLFKAILFSKAVDKLWSHSAVYLVSTTTPINSTYTSFPQNESWFSPSTNRTYAPYTFDGTAPQQPPGLTVLNGTLYGINASQVAQSAGAAWEYAGNNYTADVATQRIRDAFTNASLDPFREGAGWEGIFTLPVCDVQDHLEWMAPYGGNMLPCCCGNNCTDTKTFVQLANLNTSVSWLDICKKQLAGTEVDISKIDYGIDEGSKAEQWWDRYSKAKHMAIVFGIVSGFFFTIVMFLCCCGLCS